MPSNDKPEADPLLAVAGAIADGEAVDWSSAESSAEQSGGLGALRQLQVLDAVGIVHRRGTQAALRELVAEGRKTPDDGQSSVSDQEAGGNLPVPASSPPVWGRLEIQDLVGEGAFGQVFRAWDPRLSRQVALKLLRKEPSASAQGSAVIREASMMARVKHPNVVTIYGADQTDGRVGIWMEFIRGRTLEDILATTGPFGPRETALIGIELCGAVGAVHRAGLVHRDIKAPNIMREHGGRLVLMDFGTGHELTDERLGQALLGTPLYAAPEVLEGQEATRSSDVYSMGVLLYHLLTGTYPVTGRTLDEVRRAHWEKRGKLLRDVHPDLPAGLVLAIDRALQPDPSERLSTIAEMESQLVSVLAGSHAASPQEERAGAGFAQTHRRRWWIGAAAATVVLCAATAAAVSWLKPEAQRMATKLVMPLSPADYLKEDPAFDRPLSTAIDVSPNGNRIAFVGQVGKNRQIYVRHLTESTAELLDDTDGASAPVFSPDGMWLAFVTGSLIRKVPATGGEATTIAEVVRRVRPPGGGSIIPSAADSDVYGLAWVGMSEIVFGRFTGGLWRVSAAGGTPTPLTTLDESAADFAHRLPHVVAKANTVLFTAVSGVAAASTRLVAVSLTTGERRAVLEDAADGHYVERTGHLVFMRQGQLMAVPFDTEKLAPQGSPVKMLDGVMQSLFSYRNQLNVGAAQFAFSDNGQTFAYVPGNVFPDEARSLVWVDAAGKSTATGVQKGAYMRPDVSPDGRSALFTCWSGGKPNVCLFDFDRQINRRITEGLWPLWAPGNRLTFGRLSKSGVYNLFGWTLDGSGSPELLVQSTRDQWAGSWSPDGTLLAFVETSPSTDNDIWVYSAGTRKVHPFLRTPAREDHPEFSPDGKWMAFASNESGRDEVYITESPTPKSTYSVSTDGGTGPVWSRDGTQLFYATSGDPDGLTVMGVDVRYDPRLTLSRPRRIVSGDYLALASVRSYDISDLPGAPARFLLVHDPPDRHVTHLNVILNWDVELRALRRNE